MRSSVLLSAAVCAAGVYATPLDLEQNDKRAVETEWSFQTFVETSTTELPPTTTWSTVEQAGGPAPAAATTFTLPPTTTIMQGQDQSQPTADQQQQQQAQQQQQQEQQQQQQQAQQQQQPAPATQAQPETTTAPAPAPTSSSDDSGNALDNVLPTAWTSSWSTAWTEGSGNGGGAAPTQSTMSTAAATTSGAKPTNHYQETLLYNHNIHRSNHSSPSLGWSDKLQASAQKLAAGCVYKHDTYVSLPFYVYA